MLGTRGALSTMRRVPASGPLPTAATMRHAPLA